MAVSEDGVELAGGSGARAMATGEFSYPAVIQTDGRAGPHHVHLAPEASASTWSSIRRSWCLRRSSMASGQPRWSTPTDALDRRPARTGGLSGRRWSASALWLGRHGSSPDEYMAANRSLPGWAVGLSMFGSYVSSISFLANPGKAYAANWNPFVFSHRHADRGRRRGAVVHAVLSPQRARSRRMSIWSIASGRGRGRMRSFAFCCTKWRGWGR